MNEQSVSPVLRTAATVVLVMLLSACVAGHSKERRDPAQLFASANANGDGDGRVSRAEFVDGPTSAFDLADTNRDDQLSRDEIAAATKAMKGRRSAGAD